MRSATPGMGTAQISMTEDAKRGVSGLDPRLSKAVTAHSLIVAALSVVHSLRTRGLRSTLLYGASGSAIPILGELVAVNVLKVLRHHVRPQVGGVPLAIALLWYNVGYGTLAMVKGTLTLLIHIRARRVWPWHPPWRWRRPAWTSCWTPWA
jgi:hypothetical protein